MARNKFPGTCYCCNVYVPVGFGHFERYRGGWRIKCVKCASGRTVHSTDKEVQRLLRGDENMKLGPGLYTGSFRDIDTNKYDEIWLIVRSLKSIPKGENIYWVPQLSPSQELFFNYCDWKKQGLWNKECFEKNYVPRFLEEMKNPEAQRWLDTLRKAIQTKSVLIACFCSDEEMCHRSIVKQLVSTFKKDFYLLIAGSRTFNNYQILKEQCDFLLSNHLNDNIHIVEGDAKGTDKLARRYAEEKEYQLHEFPADWDTFGKSAGYKRNTQMHEFIAQFENRGCVCFWDGISKGTAHNFELCKTYKTPLRVYKFTPIST